MRVPFRLLDVFAEAPFAGNQLCVVSETPDGLDGETMQTLAHEIGFSETTFVTAVRDGVYDVRIFTADDEIAFAGHPTLGTAFALVEAGLVTSPVVQTSAAGDVTVEVDLAANQATMRQLPPVFGPEVADRDAVANAAGLKASDLVDGLPVVSASTGLAHLMVPVKDEATLRRAERDDRGCGEVCAAADAESLYLFAVRGPGDVMARMFDRGISDRRGPCHGFGRGSTGRLPVGTLARGHAWEGDGGAGRDGAPTELPPRRGRSRCRLLGDLGCRRRADRGRRRVRGLSVRPRDRTSATARRSSSTDPGRLGRRGGRSCTGLTATGLSYETSPFEKMAVESPAGATTHRAKPSAPPVFVMLNR